MIDRVPLRNIYHEFNDPAYRPWPVRRDPNAEHSEEKDREADSKPK